MQIIIPMSGEGSRFKKAGYEKIKPLIEVHGKPMIEWVLNMFPGDHDFTFICNEDHLQVTELEATLKRLKPKGTIHSIAPHKLGPVYAVQEIIDTIDLEEKTIVNYCDFYMSWDFNDYISNLTEEVDGSIPCYTGFHPHLLHQKNFYAGCKVTKQLELLEIKEKFSFTKDKSKSHHSVGTYYFSKGELVRKYFKELIDKKMTLNNEYYVSMVYELMLKDKLKIEVYDKIPYFCQWGTPLDLEEYLTYVKCIKRWSK